jgi:hypothetical protein
MTLTVAWNGQALAFFYRLRIHQAEEIDAAVIRLAETREGDLRWEPPYDRLRAGALEAAVRIDEETGTLHVLFLYWARKA